MHRMAPLPRCTSQVHAIIILYAGSEFPQFGLLLLNFTQLKCSPVIEDFFHVLESELRHPQDKKTSNQVTPFLVSRLLLVHISIFSPL